MSAAMEERLAPFWQPVETAAESLAAASPRTLAAVLTNLIDILTGDLIPRLRAEEMVLLPLLSTDLEPGGSMGLDCAGLSRMTESLSSLAGRPEASDGGRIHRAASALRALLAEQRRAEAMLVGRIRALPATGQHVGGLGDRLEKEAQASRGGQFFISEADRLPTEAWVLRRNPKRARIGHVAPGRKSPVADLVAVLESAS